ncbi:MAG: hypothetical protein IK100_07445 [Muribaculaceae bacterium]|nr:hypothetical protein [Muribaculaceae bacterium]MBR5118463.1 hypothetical protein [Muribaculaceae bacterium]
MKPITNILLILALVFYVFLPIMEISHMGSITGMDFSASLLTLEQARFTTFALTPFVTIFLAIAFNCLRSRWWGILDAILILLAIFFFVSMLTKFQGLPLAHNPEVVADTEMSEGMPIDGLRSGYYLSAGATILAFISALVSLMPFEFNKRIEERIDKRFESGKRQIGKMGHTIHDEFHKIGTKKPKENMEQPSQATPTSETPTQEPTSTSTQNADNDSRFMPSEMDEDEKYRDYMPK